MKLSEAQVQLFGAYLLLELICFVVQVRVEAPIDE